MQRFWCSAVFATNPDLENIKHTHLCNSAVLHSEMRSVYIHFIKSQPYSIYVFFRNMLFFVHHKWSLFLIWQTLAL